MTIKKLLTAVSVVVVLGSLAAGGVIGAAATGVLDLGNQRPSFVAGEIHKEYYDGLSDDLLTGGMGVEGMKDAKTPPYYDNYSPQEDELRKNAIHNNYRGLFDTTEAGGFARLLGPNIGSGGEPIDGDGTIAGWEYIAYEDDGTGTLNVTMMVQVPDSFDPASACFVTGPSSGSRGVYGGLGASGDWGLKRGCIVAYTDKGTGTGLHYLQDDTVTTMRGRRMSRAAAGAQSNFSAPISDAELEAYSAKWPNRMAFKHAHSQRNPEADWGSHTLNALEFAFYVANELHGVKVPGTNITFKTITPENSVVIALGISNAGTAALMAAEQDEKGMIDGVVVSEPNVQVTEMSQFTIFQGNKELGTHSKTLLDYHSFQSLYQPCASAAKSNAGAPFNLIPKVLGHARCAALAKHGLLKSSSPDAQADEAQKLLNDYGLLAEQNVLAPSHMAFDVYPNVGVNYVYAYGRFSVLDNVCGYSFGAVDSSNQPGEINKEMLETMFGYGNGIPPTGPAQIIYNDSVTGPVKHVAAISKSTGLPDMGLDGQLCIRALTTGVDPVSGKPLTGDMLAKHERVKKGMMERQNSARLRGKPALVLHGRSDPVVAPNHSSRAYYAVNKTLEGQDSSLRYYEVLNAQHLDAFNQFPGFSDKFVPLHYYVTQAADLLFDHLTSGTPLPPSQVVRPTPRKAGEPLAKSHLPDLQANPGSDAIVFTGSELRIPH